MNKDRLIKAVLLALAAIALIAFLMSLAGTPGPAG